MTPEMECCFAYNLIEIQKRWLEHSLRMVGSIALFDQLDHILKRGMRKTRKMSMFACDKQNRRAQFGLVLKFYLKRGGSINDPSIVPSAKTVLNDTAVKARLLHTSSHSLDELLRCFCERMARSSFQDCASRNPFLSAPVVLFISQ